MTTRSLLLALSTLALLTVTVSLPAFAQDGPELTRDQSTVKLQLNGLRFHPGDEIQVRVIAAGLQFDPSAWVGILPADIPHGDETRNDEHDLDYRYLRTNHDREYWFTAPPKPGRYDVRVHDSDNSGKELHAITFTVEADEKRPRDHAPNLRLDAERYKRGQWIRVEFEAPAQWPADAWLGILPAEIPHGDETRNDAHDVDYRYLQGLTWGVVRMMAPAEPGRYEIRLHDTDNRGKEWKAVPFVVE